MSGLVKTGTRRQVPRRRWLEFVCSHCGRGDLAWRSTSGHGRTALIREMLMQEGNFHPIFVGEYLIGPETEDSEPNQDPCEWTCAKCGRPVEDSQGFCLNGISSMIRHLWEKRRRWEHCGTAGSDLSEPDTDCSFLFQEQADESELAEHTPDLRCPQCGHQEFIEQQNAVLFTPVQMVNGELTWLYHDRLIADYWDGHETYYHCPKCGFEAPEPFDEWVEHGCPADWEDDF
jgi:DNA-directed RNA polymerase subunit RPC12/RpoP